MIGLMRGKGLAPVGWIWRPQRGAPMRVLLAESQRVAPVRAALLAEFATLDDSTRAIQELQNFEMFDQKYSVIFYFF